MTKTTQKKTRNERIQSRSAERRAKQKEELRSAILVAAKDLFLEHGYEGFSLRQVAEEVGYSPTTIYLYFADKDELLLHVSLEGFQTFGEMLRAGYESSNDPRERLGALGEQYFKFGLENPANYRLMFMQRTDIRMEELPEGYESIEDSFGYLARTVHECIGAGYLHGDAKTLANFIWSGIHGIVSLALVNDPYYTHEDAEASFALYKDNMHRVLNEGGRG